MHDAQPSDAPTQRSWYRPLRARNPDEAHRASTPLELLFDLCFVVAVALAAGRLHHALAENHIGPALVGYAMVFFAIWWAWMNFTWFASAFDNDDVPYRLATLVQIAGALVLAAGVPRAFDSNDFAVVTFGYLIMRVALVAQWLRAARADTTQRRSATRYASGVGLCQVGWLLRLALPTNLAVATFVLLALAELAVPIWAERGSHYTWHPGHIAERYSLFTLIVLGESILAATTAIQVALDGGAGKPSLLLAAGSGLLIVFAMWWIYFDHTEEEQQPTPRNSFAWGYGHLVIFAAAAAVGAGLQVAIDATTGTAHLPTRASGLALAVPIALYLLGVWGLNIGSPQRTGLRAIAPPLVAVLIIAAGFTPWALSLIALLLVLRVVAAILTRQPDVEAAMASRH